MAQVRQIQSPQDLIAPNAREEMDRWVAKYPAEHRKSAVLACLRIAQEQNGGWLTTELMDAVAAYLALEPIEVYEVATFYSMFELKPVGRHKISICTNISCQLCGSDAVVAHLEKKLGIKLGDTTPDGRFTLKEVECLGACVDAPMFQVGKTYHGPLTPEKIDAILDQLD